jgi:hypothetical protein
MKLTSVSAAVLVAFCSACGHSSDGADAFRAATPSRQSLKVAVPAKSSQALSPPDTGSQQSALGQTAVWYQNTVAVAAVVNGGLVWVSALCEDIITYPATSVTADTAVWGPFTAPLSPITYRFTVTKSGGDFNYTLEGKPKTSDDSAFVKVLVGTHTPGAVHVGQGTFTVDWDASKGLNPAQKEVGKAAYTYQRTASGDVTVGTVFTQVLDDQTQQRFDANYAFSQTATGPGSLDYVEFKDLKGDGKLERAAVKSRWQQTGAGRSELSLSQGDFTSTVTGSECWDTNFMESYYTDSAASKPTVGSESACPFTPASYSTL